MGLGIKTVDNIYNVAEIPLDWENNEILANHFRMLADYIEQNPMLIRSAAIVAPLIGAEEVCYDKPSLQLIGFIKEEKK